MTKACTFSPNKRALMHLKGGKINATQTVHMTSSVAVILRCASKRFCHRVLQQACVTDHPSTGNNDRKCVCHRARWACCRFTSGYANFMSLLLCRANYMLCSVCIPFPREWSSREIEFWAFGEDITLIYKSGC